MLVVTIRDKHLLRDDSNSGRQDLSSKGESNKPTTLDSVQDQFVFNSIKNHLELTHPINKLGILELVKFQTKLK